MVLLELLKLYLSLAIVFALPGYFLGKFLLAKNWKAISVFEKTALVGGLSISVVDFGMIALDRFSIEINNISLLIFLAVFCLICHLAWKKFHKKGEDELSDADDNKSAGAHLDFKKNFRRQYLLFLLLLIFAFAIRSFYVSRGILPQTTDLGHHMYWSKHISQTGSLPNYGMPDFIIGEHLPFAAVQIFSGISYISAFPVIAILIINILSLFAIFILAQETAELFSDKKRARQIAFVSFFVASSFYAVAAPQSKFVSGGVIGNIIGNFYLPFAFYLFIKTIKTKEACFASIFILALATLAYTHHLSSFVFLYSFVGFLLLLIFLLLFGTGKLSVFLKIFVEYLRLFLRPQTIFFFALFLMFVFFFQPPSYLNPEAIDTAVGAPSKETRVGLSLGSIIENTGPWRFFYSSFGLLFLGVILAKELFAKKKDLTKYPTQGASIALLIAWGVVIFLMSFKPGLLKVDIPSGRIASYLTFPFTILSSIGVVYILSLAKKSLSRFLYLNVFLLIFGVGIVSGMSDISESARDAEGGNELEVNQTYAASEYLASTVAENDVVLKDHIYLSGDTWMKLFFMKDYRYPLSRSFLRRYEDIVTERETCTRDMIAIPDSEIATQCFSETNVSYIVLKKGYDTAQFEKSKNFEKVYFSDSVAIYHRINSNQQ